MAIVCSDVHGDIFKVRTFLEYKPEDLHIFAGDAVDSFNQPPDQSEACLKMLVESDSILLYGNHELSYSKINPMPCSGKTYAGLELYPKYVDIPERWLYAYTIDNYLITHAGLNENFEVPKRLKTIVKHINREPKQKIIKSIGPCRGGYDYSGGGILWYDYKYETNYSGFIELNKNINQVFGHTQSLEPWEERTEFHHHVCVNTVDTRPDFWVFDTSTKQLVKLI